MTVHAKGFCLLGSGLLVLAAATAGAHASALPDVRNVGSRMLQTTQSVDASRLHGARYLKDARITLAQARAIALKACRGKIVSQELEKEHGGSGLRYSFDIRKKSGVVHEVGVDARTGKVLENSIEKGQD